MIIIKIPIWKAYLYSYIRRYKTYVQLINRRIGFKKLQGFSRVVRSYYYRNGLISTFNAQNKLKNYSDFVTLVENQGSVRDIDYLVAYQLNPLRDLNLGDLFMETKNLIKFAGEVGINSLKAKKMDPEKLARAIIEKLDENSSYSSELYSWYEAITAEHPEWFEDSEDAVSVEEILEQVENAESLETLHEILDGYPQLFPDIKKLKKLEAEELMDKMVEILNNEPNDAAPTETSPEEENEATEEEASESMTVEELKEIVTSATELSELKEIVSSIPEMKGKISIKGGFLKVETLRSNILKFIEENMEESTEESGEAESIEAEMTRLKGLSLPELKKEATELGLNVKTIIDKKKILALIQEALEATVSEENETVEEMEVTPEFIKECVKTKDMDSLLKIAEELQYKPNILEKRTPGKLGDKLITIINELEPEEPKKEKAAMNPMTTVLKMVRSGKSEKEIATVIKPMLKAMGKNEIAIAQRLKQMIEIAKEEG